MVEKMKKIIKKIGLIICASNFERHQNIIKVIHRKLKEKGKYILYVITNYGVYNNDTDEGGYRHGEPAIYSLLDKMDLDGCIMEANIGSDILAEMLAKRLKKRGIPLITINLQVKDTPFLNLDNNGACRELVEHMISEHGHTKINLVMNQGNSVVSQSALDGYRYILEKNNIPYDERRVITSEVRTDCGAGIINAFEQRGVMQDAESVICVHDVSAIGLCLELERRGYRVPEDLCICSMNFSNNSLVFRPDISGVDRMDEVAGGRACVLLEEMINGCTIPIENYYYGDIRYGRSCGCIEDYSCLKKNAGVFQQLIINKIEAANQVSSMMHFNDSLEEVESLEQLGTNLQKMMEGIGCDGFFCSLNPSDIDYILSDSDDPKSYASEPYDDEMLLVSGMSERTGVISNIRFPAEQLAPVELQAGDIMIVFPIHHIRRDYGFMSFLNSYLPIEVYNYRICHESVGNSIENLHRKMILKSYISQLDELHMRDQLTSMYNRFAMKRFAGEYTDDGEFIVAIADMDGLKYINDNFGHQAGNNAICIVADTMRKFVHVKDLLIRYGGDEFLVISKIGGENIWVEIHESINKELKEECGHQKLPYPLGVSMGWAVSSEEHPLTMTEAIEIADRNMYENKKSRKAERKD